MMRGVFFHDHRIFVSGKALLSRGGLSPQIISQYLDVFGDLTICSRTLQDAPERYVTLAPKDVQHIDFPDVLGKDLLQLWRAYRVVKNSLHDQPFVIARLPSISGLFACLLLRKQPEKLLIELVGCPFDSYWHYGSLRGKFLAPLMYILVRYCVNKAVNISYVTQKFLQNRYPTKARNVLSLSDATIHSEDGVLSKRICRIKNSSGNYIKLGMVGNYEVSYKGYDVAFKALAILNSRHPGKYSLSLVGGGSETKLRAVAKEHGLADCVSFEGVKSYPQGIFDWFDGVDIFLQPSRLEGLPRALIEALSRGCTAIGSSVGGIPELLTSEFLIQPHDFRRLAGLVEGLSDKAKSIQVSEQNFQHAKQYDSSIVFSKRREFLMRFVEKSTIEA